MDKNLYIDASHPNETRIVLKSGNSIEEYEFEDKNKLNFKNNIYLGTVSRVEPSLQAAFINFGRVKHGFLAFNDIQSDYYQIPTEDKDKLQQAEEKIREDLKNTNSEEINSQDSNEVNQKKDFDENNNSKDGHETNGALINEKNDKQLPINDVTRFHLGNGATIEDININANVSEVGFNRSFGVMVNYLYELKNIEKNHEDYINNRKVIISDKLKKFI